jgi:hypothetical protein
MPLTNLLNVPNGPFSWEQFGWNNQDILTKIRQAIQSTTGNITSIVMTSNGSGYTSAPAVTITDLRGNGSGATATATYSVSNNVYSINVQVTNEGTGYINPVVNFSGGGGTGATAEAQLKPIINLPQYQTYPIIYDNPRDFQFWLIQNSQAHNDFNSVLNLQSSDLTGVDIRNQKQLEAWVYLNYKELDNACFALGIS